MMYNKKLVASVKCAGKIMREQNDTVFLPFGEEYSILLKNLSSQKAVVHIEIDGRQVVPDGVVIHPNVSVDLERFVIESDLNKGPRLKFIEKTDEISDHRGDTIDDGIVRISYQFERVCDYRVPHDVWGGPYYGSITMGSGGIDGTMYTANNGNSALRSQPEIMNMSNDAGITVNGSESNQ